MNNITLVKHKKKKKKKKKKIFIFTIFFIHIKTLLIYRYIICIKDT